MRWLFALLLLAPSLAGCAETVDGEDGWAVAPQVSFTTSRDPEGRTFTVTKVTNGPVLHSELDVQPDACAWQGVGERVAVGDRLLCVGEGTLEIVHAPTDTLIYRYSF